MVSLEVSNSTTLLLIVFSFFVIQSACNKVPNDAFENPRDPISSDYSLNPISGLTASLNNDNQTITLSWSISPNDVVGVSGFMVYRSLTDTSGFQVFKVVETGTNAVYSINHPIVPGAFNYLYRVNPFFIRNNDTLFYDSGINPVPNTPSIAILDTSPNSVVKSEILPFNIPPIVRFDVLLLNDNFFDNSEISIYQLTEEEEFIEIGALTSSESKAFELDVNTELPAYYYNLTNSNYYSRIKPILLTEVDLSPNIEIKVDSSVAIISASFTASQQIDEFTCCRRLTEDETSSWTKNLSLFELTNSGLSLVMSEISNFSQPFLYEQTQTDSRYILQLDITTGNYNSLTYLSNILIY
jgi:hypothetical protein